MKEEGFFRKLIIYIFVALSITAVVLVCVGTNEHGNAVISGSANDYSKNWMIKFGNRALNSEELPIELDNTECHDIVMTKGLYNIKENNQAIVFFTKHQKVRVYVDDELRYEYGSEADGKFGVSPGNRYNVVNIDTRDNGKIMKIVITSPYESVAGYCPQIFIGDRSECIWNFIKADALPAIASMFLLLQGIVLILIHVLAGKYLQYDSFAFLNLGLAMILIGIWSFSESVLVSMTFKSTAVLSMITFSALHLALVPVLMFWRDIFRKRYHNLFDILALVELGLYFVCLMLHVTKLVDFTQTVRLIHIMYLLMFSVVAVVAISSRNQIKSESRSMMVYGVFVVFLGAVIDMYIYYNEQALQSSTFTKIGLLLYAYIPIVVLMRETTHKVNLGREVGNYRKIAYTDNLTGVGNRAAFNMELESISPSEYYKYSIINFDVNDLKITNDKYGHECGDSLIITAARAITDAFQKYGTCYRTGGDEFIVVLYKCDEKMYKKLLKKMKTYLDGVKLNEKVGIKIASGFAEYMYDTDSDLYATLKRADMKMYEEKRLMKQGLLVQEDVQDDDEKEQEKPDLKIIIDEEAYPDLIILGNNSEPDENIMVDFRGDIDNEDRI